MPLLALAIVGSPCACSVVTPTSAPPTSSASSPDQDDAGPGTIRLKDAGGPAETADGAPAAHVDGGGSLGDDAAAPPDDAALPPQVIDYVDGVLVSTLAGSNAAGTMDGTGTAAHFDNPTGMAIDANGNLLVTDYDSSLVRLVTPAGAVTTIAAGSTFADPFAAVVATDGTYYVQTDADSTGVKSATSGTIWQVTPLGGGAIATPTVVAQGLGRPRGLAPVAGGNLFVVDLTEQVAEELTVATGQASLLAGAAGAAGDVNATGASARFNAPTGAATMPDGSFLVTDSANNVVRRITTGGVVTTYAGNGVANLVDGSCASASFNAARGVAVDAAGNAYVSDIGNHVIRRISVACVVETLAGNGTAGFADGPGSAAELYGQEGIAVTPDGKTVYVADGNGGNGAAYHRVRAIAIP
jgi:sugar lactone lactonase YvrE